MTFDVERVAKVARLSLSQSEKKKFQKDVKEILKAFKVLDKAKTKEKPSFQPLETKDVMRSDSVESCLSQNEALRNTKHKEKGYFKGPRAV